MPLDKCCCEVTTADAGEDQIIADTFTTLDANVPAIGCGRWSVTDGSGVFKNKKKYNTVVTGLSAGINVFTWTISLDCRNCPCAETSTDTVVITVT